MRTASFFALPVLALAVAACGGAAGPSSTPSSSAGLVDPTPVVPTPSPATGDATYWMRLSTWQAIPPQNLFGFGNTAVIDGSGVLALPGAVPAIYPGPLVTPLFGRQVSDEGKAQIVAWAEELGLLDGETDFTGGGTMPGSMTGRIELTVDGERVTLTGVPPELPSTGEVEPGSPAAFKVLWSRLADLPGNLNTVLGPEQPYTPAGYALLLGPAPAPEVEGLDAQVKVWPLETPVNEFGAPVMSGSERCGVVTGQDAVTMGEALAQANQLTQWTATAETSATFGLTVRTIVAGENPCMEVFGAR